MMSETRNRLHRLRHELYQPEPEWSADLPDGFTHWPYRLAQHLTVAGDDRMARWESIVEVVVDVADAAAAAKATNRLNAHTAGWAYVFDAETRTITARASSVGPAEWDQPWVRWVDASLLAFWHADVIADALAADVAGRVAMSWPAGQTAPRAVPDEMWTYLSFLRSRPEWVFSRATAQLTDMTRTLDLLMGLLGDAAGDAELLPAGFAIRSYSDPAAHVQYEVQGQLTSTVGLGIGYETVIRFPRDPQVTVDGSVAAMLNLAMSADADIPQGGAWLEQPGELAFRIFVPEFCVRNQMQLPSVADPAWVPVNVTATLTHAVALAFDSTTAHESRGWSEPFASRLEDDDQALLAGVLAPCAEAIADSSNDALEADVRLLSADDISLELVTWGIFNPIGPTLVTVHLTEPDRAGQRWLVRLQRHPFGPDYRVYGPVDPGRPADAIHELLDGSIISAPEFVDMHACPPAIAATVVTAIKAVVAERAAASDEDLAADAHWLTHYKGRAWDRLNRADEPRSSGEPATTPDDAVERWWEAVADSENVIGHLLAFPSAWDGAIKFLHDAARSDDA